MNSFNFQPRTAEATGSFPLPAPWDFQETSWKDRSTISAIFVADTVSVTAKLSLSPAGKLWRRSHRQIFGNEMYKLFLMEGAFSLYRDAPEQEGKHLTRNFTERWFSDPQKDFLEDVYRQVEKEIATRMGFDLPT